MASSIETADGRLVHANATQNPDLLWAERGAGPGFPGIVTRFHLQTYETPRVMWHDTWTFRLDDTMELLTWLPGLDRRVEPIVAATRLPDVPLHAGTSRPGGTVLLLHTTVMADCDADALALLAALLREGYGHVAFDVADLDAAYHRAVARGARPVVPPGPSPEPGVRMAFVADPEGNLIELLHRPALSPVNLTNLPRQMHRRFLHDNFRSVQACLPVRVIALLDVLDCAAARNDIEVAGIPVFYARLHLPSSLSDWLCMTMPLCRGESLRRQ